MWNFTRIGRKTKKLWLSIILALRRSYQPRLGQPQKVWTAAFLGRAWTSQNRCEALFFLNREKHAVQIWHIPQTCVQFSNRYLAQNSTTLGNDGNSASSRFSWRQVWTGVKCNFSSAHLHRPYVVGKLSISQVRMSNFTRIGRKTKKLWLSIIPARTLSDQPGLQLGPPQKGVNCNFSSPELDKPYIVRKLSILEA